MVFEFRLPDVGEGVAEGEIVEWLVEPGDEVHEDQPVAEVETDKAVVEVPSPVNGVVRELRAEAGEVVDVGSVFITFEVEGEAAAEPAEEAVEAEPAGGGADAQGDEPAEGAGGRVFASPSARRLARELDVDIAAVDGSGPGGRVTEEDVRTAAGGEAESPPEHGAAAQPETAESGTPEGDAAREQAESPAAGGVGGGAAAPVEPADRDRTLAAPATRRLADDLDVDLDAVPASEEREGEAFVTQEDVREYAEALQAAEEADAGAAAVGAGEEAAAGPTGAAPRAEGAREERVPYRGIRRTIGQQMERSKFTAPHVTHHDEVDVTDLVDVRAQLKGKAEERGIKLTYLPFVIKAVTAALKEFPDLNASLDEESEEIVHKRYYNIGVATATDAGLMVPVIENADGKGLLQLSTEINEKVQRARDRSIAREEMQGGTFTITNFGAIGGEYATPIINYPEVAILGLGAIKERPWVREGEVVPRHVMTLSLSIDHRVIDGAVAAQFTNRVMDSLRNPVRFLLD